ncbi:hypothetical protein, partial [Rhizobium halophilum]|uniref:hypothetical protein n=1 Tax=Rhizobium halophilum TaxID=2846852 RepID=UPI001EFED565
STETADRRSAAGHSRDIHWMPHRHGLYIGHKPGNARRDLPEAERASTLRCSAAGGRSSHLKHDVLRVSYAGVWGWQPPLRAWPAHHGYVSRRHYPCMIRGSDGDNRAFSHPL